MTWNILSQDGVILWWDWNDTELFIQVTDGADLHTVLQFQVEAPLMVEDTKHWTTKIHNQKSWVVNTLVGLIFALAIVALSIFTVVHIRLRRQSPQMNIKKIQ